MTMLLVPKLTGRAQEVPTEVLRTVQVVVNDDIGADLQRRNSSPTRETDEGRGWYEQECVVRTFEGEVLLMQTAT